MSLHPFISLIEPQHLFYPIRHLLKLYLDIHFLIVTYEFWVAFVMFQHCLEEINLLLERVLVFFLAIPIQKKVTKSKIFKQKGYLFLGMLYFMKPFFLFHIFQFLNLFFLTWMILLLFLILYHLLPHHKTFLLLYVLLDVPLAFHDPQFGLTIISILNHSLLLLSILFPIILSMIVCPLLILLFFLLSLPLKNLPLTMRQSLILVGHLLWTLNYKLWRLIIHGRLLIFHRATFLLAIMGLQD